LPVNPPLLTRRTGHPPIDTIGNLFPASWMTRMRFLMTHNGGPQPDHELYAEMERFLEELIQGRRACWPPGSTRRARFWAAVQDGEGDPRQVYGPED
jgi:hypothetical protein